VPARIARTPSLRRCAAWRVLPEATTIQAVLTTSLRVLPARRACRAARTIPVIPASLAPGLLRARTD